MKLLAAVVKTLKENIREWKVLVMVLGFAPFFLIMMYLLYGGGPTIYKIGLMNLDQQISSSELISTLKETKGQGESELFELVPVSEKHELEMGIKDKSIDLGLVIPGNYSARINVVKEREEQSPSIVEFYGSMNNVRYPVAAVMVGDAITKQGIAATEIELPVEVNETFLEQQAPSNEFESYVPGLLSLAVLMIMFSGSAAIVRENDKKTLLRLKLSQISALSYLTAVGIVQALISIAALVLSYWTAIGLGYQPAGSFGTVLIVGVLSSLSIVSVSLVVASFLNTVFDVLTAGCFPFFILMFFSGSMFPLPKLSIITVLDHPLGITDVLPLSHTVNAFNKILNYGAGWQEIWFEVTMIVLLTLVYFVAGIVLYQKRKLSKA